MYKLGASRARSGYTAVASACALTMLALIGCAQRPSTPPSPAFEPLPPGSTSTSFETPVTVTDGDFITAISQAPDGRIFFTERGGRIGVTSPVDKTISEKSTTFAQLEANTSGERGLLGIDLHPSFTERPFVYVFLSPATDPSISQVVRFQDADGIGINETVIIELPAGSGCCHKGGRVRFGPDGKLYVTLGDNSFMASARDARDVRGSLLRYNDDGSIPEDNPFGTPVWAYGLRNPFGLGFAPDGTPWVTENGPSGNDGPSCCDEVNRIEKGGNYGWPDSYGNLRTGVGIPPVWDSGGSALVPTGITVLTSAKFAELDGAVVFCNFRDNRMRVITQSGADWVAGLSTPGYGPDGCGTDVIQGLEGTVYISDRDRIYRLG